ncbi:hypothetical protein DUI87_03321 [Hirundo rustica rustica]|uniref:ribonuclease H n=1 Tax=Hirundo rustica rustica TaxID=333673 RepID=A0A3M0LKW5_HIRRU|nr:hypothetical protein DUI87_03321 [Hirundo rustica rustica]
MSPYNTPILPVKKPDGTYRMVQDLRIINEIVKAGHPTLPDPYTILNQIPSSHQYYSVLDLKDAFWGWPITEDSKQYFAFEWEHEEGGKMRYKNSPTIFGEQLAKDLESWEPPPGEGQLLQYVDDLLIATWTQETRVDWTVSLLNFLGLQGYRVSQKKAQMVRQTVIYLGYERFLKYQAILVEQDDVEIVVTNIVNPASFLSGSMGEPVIHDCLETIEATYSSRPDLKDTPLEDAETWFADGSSYVVSGRRHAGYAVTTSREVIESGPLPTNTSAQKAEIIALIRALELAKRKEINIYTDSRYAFGVVLAHGAIWKERGLLNSQGKSIKHAQEILRLLDAVQLPERVAIMHIKAHQKVSSELEEGNMLADREAKEAAKGEVPDKAVEAALIPDGKVSIEGVNTIPRRYNVTGIYQCQGRAYDPYSRKALNKILKVTNASLWKGRNVWGCKYAFIQDGFHEAYHPPMKLIRVCTAYHKNETKIIPPVPRKAVITNMPAIPEVEEQITPVVTKIGPYAIKKAGVQKLIVNPKWSLKRVEMGVQVNASHVRTECAPFLRNSFMDWTTWLQKSMPPNFRNKRDLTGLLGTGLGVLNTIDSDQNGKTQRSKIMK